jgi:hypothetical protein
MGERALDGLRAELEAMAPYHWPAVLRSITARRAAAELLTALDRPPRSCSRLGWELRKQLSEKEAA